jgi:hypothetical protein
VLGIGYGRFPEAIVCDKIFEIRAFSLLLAEETIQYILRALTNLANMMGHGRAKVPASQIGWLQTAIGALGPGGGSF